MSTGICNKLTGYHNRRSIRLNGYDYSRSGAYFITICIHDRKQRLFGDVVNGEIVPNDAGKNVEKCWVEIPNHFPNAEIDEYVIMPNHFHGIIFIHDPAFRKSVGANNHSPLREIDKRICGTSKTIGSVVRGFKIGVTKWFRASNPGTIVWQRNYFEHIIRNDKSLFLIRQYIRDNPLKWDLDIENHIETEIRQMEFHPAGG